MRDMKTTLFLLLMGALVAPTAGWAGDEDEGSDEDAPVDETPADDAADAAAQAAREAAAAAAEAAPDVAATAADAVTEAANSAATEAASEATPEAAAEAASEATPEAAAEAVAAEGDEAAAKPVVSLVAEAGAVWLHGNTKSINANGLVNFSLMHDKNKIGFHFGGAYGRGVVPGSDSDEWVEVAKKVWGGLRYDRYIIQDVNSIYVMGAALHDPLAGFLVQARADVGYSHTLVKTDKHDLKLEGGFNYSRDQFTDEAGGGGQNFFGGRVFAGYALNLDGTFGFQQSIEALLGGRENSDAGESGFDGKLTSQTGITANITKILGVKFGFGLTYDFHPPVNAETGESFEALDTITSLALVATLL